MSRLDDLIQEYCPNGVAFKPLEQCCVILDNKRKPIKKGFRKAGNYPYYGANGVQDFVSDYIFDGSFVLVGEDGSVLTENGTPVVNWAEGKIWVNNHAHIIAEQDGIMLRYLYHYLQTVNISSLIHGNIPKLTGKDFKAIKVPVPALPVQREIVRILDTYTELTKDLTDKLTAKLAVRKKQYEYYKDMLINNQNDRKQYKLEDIATYSTDRIEASNVDENTYVGVDNLLQDKKGKKLSESVPESGKIIGYKRKDILIGNIRPYLKKIWLADNDGGTNGDVLTIRVSNNNVIIAEYLYYVLSSDVFFNYDNSHSKGAKMPRGDKKAVMQYKFALPSIKEQERIVSILDRFDTLCNDISTGLPAEIEARQKQYEYYRDKLLTFKERQH